MSTEAVESWGYMRWPVIRSLYDDLENDSQDNAVDILWMNILWLYFKVQNNYGLEAVARLKREGTTDFTIRCIRKGRAKKIFIIGEKKTYRERPNAIWSHAEHELLEHMSEVCTRENNTVYGIVTVGHYSKFFTLSAEQPELSYFVSNDVEYNGRLLHFKEDEHCIHTLLEDILDRTDEFVEFW